FPLDSRCTGMFSREEFECTDQCFRKRLGTEPAQDEGERHRAPDLGLELLIPERSLERRHPWNDAVAEVESSLVALDHDPFDAELRAEESERGAGKESLDLGRRWPETIPELGTERCDLLRLLEPGEAPVEVQLL